MPCFNCSHDLCGNRCPISHPAGRRIRFQSLCPQTRIGHPVATRGRRLEATDRSLAVRHLGEDWMIGITATNPRLSTAFTHPPLRSNHDRHDAFLPAVRTGATGTYAEVINARHCVPGSDPLRRHARGARGGDLLCCTQWRRLAGKRALKANCAASVTVRLAEDGDEALSGPVREGAGHRAETNMPGIKLAANPR
jgi:hypothetical protein